MKSKDTTQNFEFNTTFILYYVRGTNDHVPNTDSPQSRSKALRLKQLIF